MSVHDITIASMTFMNVYSIANVSAVAARHHDGSNPPLDTLDPMESAGRSAVWSFIETGAETTTTPATRPETARRRAGKCIQLPPFSVSPCAEKVRHARKVVRDALEEVRALPGEEYQNVVRSSRTSPFVIVATLNPRPTAGIRAYFAAGYEWQICATVDEWGMVHVQADHPDDDMEWSTTSAPALADALCKFLFGAGIYEGQVAAVQEYESLVQESGGAWLPVFPFHEPSGLDSFASLNVDDSVRLRVDEWLGSAYWMVGLTTVV